MPVRHEGGEDMLANALGGLELSDREPRLGLSGMPHVLLGTMEVRYDACFQAALSGGTMQQGAQNIRFTDRQRSSVRLQAGLQACGAPAATAASLMALDCMQMTASSPRSSRAR